MAVAQMGQGSAFVIVDVMLFLLVDRLLPIASANPQPAY